MTFCYCIICHYIYQIDKYRAIRSECEMGNILTGYQRIFFMTWEKDGNLES